MAGQEQRTVEVANEGREQPTPEVSATWEEEITTEYYWEPGTDDRLIVRARRHAR